MTTPEAQQILDAVTRAANAASEAAQALREANEQSRANKSGFAEASKVVKIPDAFGNSNSADDQGAWLDFSFSFKQWLFYADAAFENDMAYVEKHLEVPVSFTATAEGISSEQRSKKLFAILSGLLQHRPLKILKQVPNNNGLEVWRQLTSIFTPKTKTRALGILSALMGHPAFTKEKTLLEQIHGLQRLADAYNKASGTTVSDDLLLTTLVKCLPKQIQQHVQLGMTEDTTFEDVKEKVVAFERLSSTWAKERVYSELGMVTSYADSGGPAPMEINYVGSKGKGKSKTGKGKGNPKGKGKDKGKSKDANKGKGKFQQQQSGKGYNSPSKGGGKVQSKTADVNRCNYCGAFGHWKKDCRKFQADKAAGVVRQVESENPSQRVASSPSSTGTAQQSPSASSYRSTGNVNRVAFNDSTVVIEDLTEFSDFGASSSGVLRVLQQVDVAQFDMTCTDSDEFWTFSPTFADEPNRFHHVRMMSFAAGSTSEQIILDSGADTSALPLSYAHVGESCSHETEGQDYIDAQGAKLDIHDTRLATVDLGNGIVLRERFIIANISCPLLALGHIVRAGWELQHRDSGVCLVKNGRTVDVSFKRNSLCVQGCIRMVSEEDCISPKSNAGAQPVEAPAEIRAIHLEPVLRRLLPGWNKINPQLYALTTRRARFVDTTICPATEMMWLRTTLVFRNGTGWELLEFSEPISELEDLEGEIYDPESVIEVLTLAHVHCVASEDLGFRLVEGDRPFFDDDTPEEPGPPQPVIEEPADLDTAEPLEEDRVVPYQDEDTVTVEGVVFTQDSPLRSLRTGCKSLGLSTRGSKKDCMKRMIEFLKVREMMEAQAVQAKLKQEVERHAVPQAKPVTPSDAERAAHNLTHEPYQTWCSLCVSHRAKQDVRKRQTHESTSHSVISFDFFYCTRMTDESDKLTVLMLTDRDTGMCLALPTLQKGGKSLSYLVTEMCRFVVQCGHTEVGLRCDGEPSTMALLEATKRALTGLRIVAHSEPAPIGDHRANGAAEAMVAVIRNKANLLVTQVEEATGCKGPVFGCLHPVYAWAIIHSSWLHNHYVVRHSMTGFERATGRHYSGKLACFGETEAFMK
eukprot:s421_g36.t1